MAELEGLAAIIAVDARADGLAITWVSPGFELLTGYSAGEVLGRDPRFLQGPDTDPRSISLLTEAVAAGRDAYVTLLNYRADGTPFWNEVAIAPQHDAGSGRVLRWLGTQRDVTDRMRASARLHELAYFDTLTGLANRAALHDELRSAMHRARVHEHEIALLGIDLDDFGAVNRKYGNEAGDLLLRVAADRLRSVIRPQDLLARTGGNEFALLLKDLPAGEGDRVARELAARILAAARDTPHEVGDLRLEVRLSIGIGLYRQGTTTSQADLARDAETALLAAKGSGKDTVRVHRAVSGDAVLSADDAFDPAAPGVLAELDRILVGGLVGAVYQPIVELTGGEVVGYEALARGPEGSSLHRPDRLFAAAGAAGRVVELEWACRTAALNGALEAGLGPGTSLFINSEPAVIDAAPPPGAAAEAWARAERELSLVIEITERAITGRPAELVRVIADQRAAGHVVALDDVGADVRSLALLSLIDPDVIKLDLSLVQDRPSAEQAAIVSAVAAERERTGAHVLAEGIETEEHRLIARSLGATLGQGWLFGRPGPLVPPLPVTRVRPSRTAGAAASASVDDASGSPYSVVVEARGESAFADATKALLLPISRHLEERALRIGEGAVLLSAFQDAQRFTPATRRRYEGLARRASLVAAFGIGLPASPVHGVRGAELAPGDALAGEWSVIVLGPHFAGALVARDLGDTDIPDRDRRFSFATVYDRALVIAAARTLIARIAPEEISVRRG
ncbi:diguanylate cyclase domain-containing protein [Conexibacter woesei]|uniref:diguanylate cyclase domain-containing protein n=1 Tax=Conexibacter woesei TaxID=191495 RepID=UPI000408C1EC|nr:diguanylate cyclase [Conexibacter woesei]